jgi:hypothetical protein
MLTGSALVLVLTPNLTPLSKPDTVTENKNAQKFSPQIFFSQKGHQGPLEKRA